MIASGSAIYAFDDLRRIDDLVGTSVENMRRSRLEIDDYTQLFPAALVYGLNLTRFKGKHNFIDRTVLLVTSQMITVAIVLPSKRIINRERPDISDKRSFPSGHAAVAFASAQFLFREYRDTNIWIAISGYPVAAFTSISRVRESKHWVSDIIAGSGVGILATELAYRLFPLIENRLHTSLKKMNIGLKPYYQSGTKGIAFVRQF